MEDILREIDAALERQGISARAASIRAQGAPEMIRDMRRGHVPSVERLRSLCEVLGLEFYVGPPRWRRAEDGGALPDVPLRALERSARDLVQLTLGAGGDPIPEDLWPVLLARHPNEPHAALENPPAMGPRVEDVDVARSMIADLRHAPIDGSVSAASPVDVSATPDARVLRAVMPSLEGDDPREASIFDDSFLRRLRRVQEYMADRLEADGFDPAKYSIVPIRDESMEPTLPNGCVTMVDSTNTDLDPAGIKVVKLGDDTLFRRIATDEAGRRLMVCDHPDWPDEPWPAGARIVGEIKWMGRQLG